MWKAKNRRGEERIGNMEGNNKEGVGNAVKGKL